MTLVRMQTKFDSSKKCSNDQFDTVKYGQFTKWTVGSLQ